MAVIDLVAALEQLGGREALLAKVLAKFGQTGPAALASAREQWQAESWEEVARTAHSMKGTAGYLFATALRQSSIDLQQAVEALGKEGAGAAERGAAEGLLKAWEAALQEAIDAVAAAAA